MGKELERDLGLYATITISIGAMIGSGIFVLPGLATKIAGPATIFAYLLAGVIVLPAALSKAEMATAMPEAGGTYLYIDRAMGPLYGTIAGVGAWFSLVFKSAFALVGLGAYLLLFVPVPAETAKLVGLGLGALLVVVNILGVEQTGRLQAAIVSLVVVALVVFIADGITYVDQTQFHPFFTHGSAGVLAATGFVFVSYAGVTKIASVAEEVEDPGRNIPIGILASILLMMLVYTLVVFVIVGVTPSADLAHTLTPMAVATAQFTGETGQFVVGVVAVLALTSMANAGVLSSARFPFAMSRDSLAPQVLGQIHERFRTPMYAVAFTGVVLLFLIAFVPVVELAKLASAFQILVFAFVNVALIAFRESDLKSYEPEFTSPGYPWVQLFGLLAGLALLTQMGIVPLVGALVILVGGYGWYTVYGRQRTDREGAALDAIRRTTSDYSISSTRDLFATGGGGGILVALEPSTDHETEVTLLELAKTLSHRRGGQVSVVRFEELPQQTPLSGAAAEPAVSPTDGTTTGGTPETTTLPGQPAVSAEVAEVVSHDTERAVANYVAEHEVNLVIGELGREFGHGELMGEDIDAYMKHVPADLVFVQNRGLRDIETISVIGDRGPYDPLEVLVADALAQAHDARLQFIYAAEESVGDDQFAQIESYHDQLAELCTGPVERQIVQADGRSSGVVEAATGSDIAIVSTSPHHLLYDVVFGTLPDALATELDCTVLLVHENEPRRHTFLRYLIERVAF